MSHSLEDSAQEIARLRQEIADLEENFLAKQTALSNVIRHIRATLDLETIFQSTVEEVRHLLDVDRVAVFEFSTDTQHQTGIFIAEEVTSNYESALAQQVTDHCFGENYSQLYCQGKIYAVADIETAPISDCHRNILKRFQVRANLVVPLIKQNQLWGLLCVHQCSQPRMWSRQDLEFVREVASHLDMAIQHTELFKTQQEQNRQQLQKIAENAPGALYQFRRDVNGEFSFPYLSPSAEAFFEMSSRVLDDDVSIIVQLTHPDDLDRLQTSIQESAETGNAWLWEGRMRTASGKLRWIEGRSQPEYQTDGSIIWFGWINDITERKASERELQALAAIIENSSDFIGIGTFDGTPEYVNPAGRRLVGLAPEESSSMTGDIVKPKLSDCTFEDFFLSEDWQWMQENIFAIVQQTGTWRGEVNFRHMLTNEPIPFDYNLFVTYAPETKEPMGLASIARDIRDRRAAEQSLLESEQRFRDVSEAVGEYLWETNLEGYYTYISERSLEVLGYRSQDLLGRNAFELIYEKDLNWLRDAFAARVERQEPFQFEYRSVTEQGQVVWIDATGIPRLDEQGHLLGYRGAGMNITERKQAEEALKQALGDLNAILDNLADGLLVTDTTGRITRFNPVLRRMFHLKRGDILGCTCEELGLTDVGQLLRQLQATPSHQAATAELQLPGNRIGQALATRVLESIPGQPQPNDIGSVILIRDVTLEKEVDRMKTDFIATVSHELRTPLTSVLGFASIVLEKLEDKVFPLLPEGDRKARRHQERVRQNLNIIISEAERLTTLINDVLDIAKMESGKVEWDQEPVSMLDVLERSISASSSLFEREGLTLITDFPETLPPVLGDGDRLIQVVINLLSNAVKFTETGDITCRARYENSQIRIEVEDTGIGIAPEDLPKVFDKFKQVGETLTDKPKGTGLGLPICKQILEHHGGQIWADSQMGQGSCFIFTLPIETADGQFSNIGQTPEVARQLGLVPLMQQLEDHVATTEESTSAQRRSNLGKTILVVDDDEHVRELLRQSLEAQGYHVRQAKDGVEAIMEVKRSRPDLIVLDVMMPYIDGFDVAAVLKNEPQTMGIPILVLSIVEDRERGYRAGVDRYLKKPIDRQGFLQEVGSLLSQGSSHKKVLVVDDDTSSLKVISELLTSQGYTVSEASNERECLDQAMEIQPDIIAIDSEFLQQHEVVQALRFEKGLEHLVFVLLGDIEDDPKSL
ncbi:PAS domain S-box protein [Geitlerinema sp. P-1104]|uniref:PAS domain S-box protein n=1 Tax=Geitlerinema sp. P-1104 TaxID=2546230 RepID=UPI001477400B|nr:PAS domain S-box protein [Geitlerinema sp. P-1104]NMG59533.1 PAS domain S-box protein [Geitlerinema sp. P-1104]